MNEISVLNGYLLKDKKAKRYYNNIELMKSDETLKKGMAVEVCDKNNGFSKYFITNEINLNGYNIKLNNNLYATYIKDSSKAESLSFGDNIDENNDDTNFIQSILNISSFYNLTISLYPKTYYVNGKLKISSNTHLDLNGAIIKLKDNANTYIFGNTENYYEQIKYIENITIENGTIDGNINNNYSDNLSGMALVLYNGKNINLKNLIIKNCQRNPLNIFETSYLNIENIIFDNICSKESSYILGGNYCIALENRTEKNPGSYCNIKNILVKNSGGHFIHIYNYDNCNVENLKITNSITNQSLSNIPLTFTNAKNCCFKNIFIDNATQNACEINQGSENIYINNMKVENCYNGLVFGANTDTSKINKNIHLNLLDINASHFVLIYNYSDQIFIENSKLAGGLGGADHNADNLYLENSKLEVDISSENKLNSLRVSNITNSNINDIKILAYSNNGKVDFIIPFDINSQSEKDIELIPLLKLRNHKAFNLKCCAYLVSSPKQNYQANYLYSYSENTDDIGKISNLIVELGSQYRKITPTITTRNQLHISTTSDVNLSGTLHFES